MHTSALSTSVFAILFSIMRGAHDRRIAIDASIDCSCNQKALDSLLGKPYQQIVAKYLLDVSALSGCYWVNRDAGSKETCMSQARKYRTNMRLRESRRSQAPSHKLSALRNRNWLAETCTCLAFRCTQRMYGLGVRSLDSKRMVLLFINGESEEIILLLAGNVINFCPN